MAKYLKLFMVALFATLTFTLSSCGDDDEPNVGGSKITINGTDYIVTDFMVYEGYYDPYGESMFGFFAHRSGSTITPMFYDFEFTTNTKPKVGDDLAKMNLTFEGAMTSHYAEEGTIMGDDYTVVSGSAMD